MADTTNRGSNVGQHAGQTVGSARQTAHEAKQTAQEAAHNVGQRVQETASSLAGRAQDVASTVGDKAESALSSVGQGMSSLASSIRQSAPHEGFMGSAAGTVADQLQSGGRYLQQHDLGDMADDLRSLIRSNPLPAICVAFGIGWLMGMASRR